MTYYLKKLGHQELGSISKPGDTPSRGRYIYISKDPSVLSFFPPLSEAVKNDSSLLPIIPLYSQDFEKIYSNYIYHNDKFHGSTSARPRNEYRIYLNRALEMDHYIFQTNDIIVLKKAILTLEITESTDNTETQTVYYADRVTPANKVLYQICENIIESSNVQGAHAIFEGRLEQFETNIFYRKKTPLRTVVDLSVTNKIQNSDTQLSDLFTPTSFRDFTMVAYENRCAVTRNVIQYGKFLNLEAAHIMPKSHGGLYMPNNGLALSRDVHWSFDKGFFTLNDDYTINVHPEVESDFLRNFDGKHIYIPTVDFLKPSLNSIQYHRENVYGLFLTSGRL
ncbi:HNH endonuclease [Sporosarcina psychrophila]|uniref:HNH endonuclease n=1 Tax=Sporosarcina psychrophila TaxID=1476 RepID=UPI00078D1129|nr:HNH endonuclease [Sporosarcina psychrophila]AMQ04619.1 hypothetical protein AZE41_00810 [Sporosarcina psychrophila]